MTTLPPPGEPPVGPAPGPQASALTPRPNTVLRPLYAAMLGCFVSFGVTLTIIGATLPQIIREFAWSYTATGVLLSAGSVGYFVTTFLAGLLVQRLGPKRVIVAGLVLQAAALAFFGATPSYWLNLWMYFLLGVGQGCTEVVVNFSVVRMEQDGQSRLMNLMHAAFSVGAIAGPFAMAALLAGQMGWQAIYRVMAGVSVLMGAGLCAMSFAGLADGDEPGAPRPRVLKLLKHPLLALSFLMLLLYVGAEMGVSNWVAEYYVKILHEPTAVGAMVVSVFWMGVLIGRAGVSWGYRGTRPQNALLALVCTATVALAAAILMPNPWLAGAGFFVTGLGFSAIYPLVMALVGKHFRGAQSVAVGVASTGGGIGAFALPFVMAAVSDALGLRAGFWFYLGLNVAMMAVAAAIMRQTRSGP